MHPFKVLLIKEHFCFLPAGKNGTRTVKFSGVELKQDFSEAISTQDSTRNELIIELSLTSETISTGFGVKITGNALRNIRSTSGGYVMIKLTVKDLRKREIMQGGGGIQHNFETEEMLIFSELVCKDESLQLPSYFKELWGVEGNEFTGEFTIAVTFFAPPVGHMNVAVPDTGFLTAMELEQLDPKQYHGDPMHDFSVIKRILKDAVASDATIIAKDGMQVKCHKNFLSAHSPVLRDALQTRNEVEMLDISEKGVSALLAYLYYWEEDDAIKDPSIALELLKAANEFEIKCLQDAMRELLIKTELESFTVPVALRLFLLCTRHLQDSILKEKAIDILTENAESLQRCDEYQALFTTDVEAVKELCNYLFIHSSKKRKQVD